MSVLTALISSKIAVAVTVSVVGVGGATAATFTGTLPPGLQEQAHHLVGAPAPAASAASAPTDSASPEPTDSETPEATDSASTSSTAATTITTTTSTSASAAVPADTHGLCTAFFAGGLPVTTVAYKRLAADATTAGAADVSGYCSAAGITPKPHTHPAAVLPTGTSSAAARTKAKTAHPAAAPSAETTHRGVTGAAHKAAAATAVRPTHG